MLDRLGIEILAHDPMLSDGSRPSAMNPVAGLLPDLFREALSAIATLEEPSSELVTLVLARIGEAPAEEIVQGLHVLWPYTRHITQDDWLEALFRKLDSITRQRPCPPM